MNNVFIHLGIEAWKPVLTALLLPPVPLLILVMLGAGMLRTRRRTGWLAITFGIALLWLSACSGATESMTQFMLQPPPALSQDDMARVKADVLSKKPVAIVVLGGGMEPYAPEYGVSNLSDTSLGRLRYGLWLARKTGAPVGFSGGVGWAQVGGSAEARIAQRIAVEEFGVALTWVEADSRDTRENAARSIDLLLRSGVQHIVLVTHAWHMPRAMRAFTAAAAGRITVQPAPMGLAGDSQTPLLTWMPSTTGFGQSRNAWREWLGGLLGA